MKLIDADKLIEDLKVDPVECPGCPEPEFLGELIEVLENATPVDVDVLPSKPSGLFECFHCGSRSVVWDSDFDYEDYGYDGEGIVQELHCANCGARVTYMISFGEE